MTQKPDYQVAVEEFEAADREYRELEKKLNDGDVIDELLVHQNPAIVKREFRAFLNMLKAALEDRNAKLKNAGDLLRQAVVLTDTQWRGPDGRTTRLTCGPFEVSSVTHRGFDAQSLMDGCQRHGVLERLMELTTVDKDGRTIHLVEQKWDVDYAGVYEWLKSHNMRDVVDGAYDEKEKSPMVKGPKALAYLGDKKADK
jgi:hypothetical protein